jgi:cytochrome c553
MRSCESATNRKGRAGPAPESLTAATVRISLVDSLRLLARSYARASFAALVASTPLFALDAHAAAADTSAGEAIYLRGVLMSGKPLEATNDAGLQIRGQAAACANCHRRSGLGSREGRSLIPPIAGRYLFRPRDARGDERYLPYVEGVRDRRERYTEATLARAIREGIDSEGKTLKVLMPHFSLGDSDMAQLIAYLKSLDQRNVPGVTDTVLHFATIITPDADPVKRRGMLAVLEQFVAERNARQMSPQPRVSSSRVVEFMAHRQWRLHVWELTGPEATWGEQLARRMKEEPVFAVLSGLAGKTWAPVHRFCEQARVPCLFPNVEAPVDAERDFYSVYFSKGVLLEAALIGNRILSRDGGEAARSVHQIYRNGDSGEVAAAALSETLKAKGITVQNHALAPTDPPEAVAAAVRASSEADALVTWLRPADIAVLGTPVMAKTEVFMSGLLGGLERAPVPAGLREKVHVAYPFDLPDRRRVRMDFAFGWFRIRNVPVVAEQVQADTFLACSLVSQTLNHVSDTFVRDYLIERIEDLAEHRIITGYYPRLTLATGQRFASKGGYIVRLGTDRAAPLVAESDWIVP